VSGLASVRNNLSACMLAADVSRTENRCIALTALCELVGCRSFMERFIMQQSYAPESLASVAPEQQRLAVIKVTIRTRGISLMCLRPLANVSTSPAVQFR
jgi:hypothetical protein